MSLLKIDRYLGILKQAEPVSVSGRVTDLVGVMARALIPGIRMGSLCAIDRWDQRPLKAEVVGFHGDTALLMPLGVLTGIGPDSNVTVINRKMTVRCGMSLKGRVLNGLGEPMDGGEPVTAGREMSVDASPPGPLERRRISKPMALGVRALDGLLTAGIGQRIGIFAAAGTGKSTLLGAIARSADADVNVVALIGERGREVLDFLEESLGEEGRRKSVVIVATSDQPALVRLKSAYVATAVAEYFRDLGLNVLLMMDSVTRFARAQREVGLAIGEPPARAGYTPSVFAMLPRLLERAGNNRSGSITALYTVLVAGDDLTEPVADETMSILDGHIILSRNLAARGHYPAVDILHSKSRVMNQVASEAHLQAARTFLKYYAAYEENREAVTFGFYKPGGNAVLDSAVKHIGEMESFLIQTGSEKCAISDTTTQLVQLAERLIADGT